MENQTLLYLLLGGVAVAIVVLFLAQSSSTTPVDPTPTPVPPTPVPPTPTPVPPTPTPTPTPTSSCGVSYPISQIINGDLVPLGKIPWQAFVQCSGLCGGSLILPNWIVTAAHCLKSKPTSPCNTSVLEIRLGTVDLNFTTKDNQTLTAEKIILHPGYLPPPIVTNDIALIKLSRPAVLNQYVNLVCLPTKQYDLNQYTLNTSGFGRTDAAVQGSDGRLRETVTFTNHPKCEALTTAKDRICTYNPSGKNSEATSACRGDSGGPLTLFDTERKSHVLVGVVSFGSSDCSAEVGYYTNVFYFLDFIKSTIAANP
jgi:secreted trypsin-like serine protease